MKPPRGWWAIDQALGQTPCLCGAVDTWHPSCYHGKSNEEIEAGYVKAYAKARKHLRDQAAVKSTAVLAKAAR